MASTVVSSAASAELDPNLRADLTPSDRLIARSGGASAGCFRAAPDCAEFAGSGPLLTWYLVFPRNYSEIRFEEGQRVVGNPAQLMLYNRGDRYRRRGISPEGDHSDYLAINQNSLEEVLPQLGFDKVLEAESLRFPQRAVAVPSRLLAAQRSLFLTLRNRPDPPPIELEERLLWLTASTLHCAFSAAIDSTTRRVRPAPWQRQRELVENAKEVLIHSLEQPPTLIELGARLHVSAFHLARLFLRHTGFTLHGFVMQQRLRLAFDMLLDTPRRRIADIAADLGFSHHSHFCGQFQREFSLTPRGLRLAAKLR